MDDPSAAFFYLIEDAGALFVAAFIVLAVALVCSSVDTLQNAVVASISRDLSDNKMDLKNARRVGQIMGFKSKARKKRAAQPLVAR